MNINFITEKEITDRLSKGKALRLSPETHEKMWADLSAHADFHAVQESKLMPGALVRPVSSPYFNIPKLLSSARGAYAFFAAILIIGLSAGTTYASENTLPGDTLYAIKVGITEPVHSALLTSSKDKATWNAELAERRLEEATQLAVQNKLDVKTSRYLSEKLSVHVAESVTNAEDLQNSGDSAGAVAARSDLEARVTAHAAILDAIETHLAIVSGEGSDENTSSTSVTSEAVAPTASSTQTSEGRLSKDSSSNSTTSSKFSKTTITKEEGDKTRLFSQSRHAAIATIVRAAYKSQDKIAASSNAVSLTAGSSGSTSSTSSTISTPLTAKKPESVDRKGKGTGKSDMTTNSITLTISAAAVSATSTTDSDAIEINPQNTFSIKKEARPSVKELLEKSGDDSFHTDIAKILRKNSELLKSLDISTTTPKTTP
jgi:Domain of unknown function (DUF5667)